ncbi:hypothetical protein N7462_003299 [Penicillium macrosclerotiorum]|uniref:uncharacterized protein n=1 Tax=Penicillium macrosclerotiorum TaxID=303699 RepID=UPI00254986FF|nr:uncharacterized protein N7462_003299 [Penicillium macrosclerotiorum]KAJ5688907.1 hypothetical protein N7462_003299 [Penicillium macrosclerotiorum]
MQVPQRPERVSVPFLLNYSASSEIHPGNVNQVLSDLATKEDCRRSSDANLPSLELQASRDELFSEDSWNIFFGSLSTSAPSQDSPLPIGLEDPDKRHAAAIRILDCLATTYSSKPDISEDFDIDHARELFNQENIHDCIMAYFDHTVRPRSRIVLKSTFNLEVVSTPLLLSIFLMGANCGLSDTLRSQATGYGEIAEVAVLDSPAFIRLMYGRRELQVPEEKRDVVFESKDIRLWYRLHGLHT